MPDNPEDLKDAIQVFVNMLMGKGPADQHGGSSGAVREHPTEDPLEPFVSIPVIDLNKISYSRHCWLRESYVGFTIW